MAHAQKHARSSVGVHQYSGHAHPGSSHVLVNWAFHIDMAAVLMKSRGVFGRGCLCSHHAVFFRCLRSCCIRCASTAGETISSRRKNTFKLDHSKADSKRRSTLFNADRKPSRSKSGQDPGAPLSEPAVDAEAVVRRKRTIDPVAWSASSAETMLLYKDGERREVVHNIYSDSGYIMECCFPLHNQVLTTN